MRTRPRCSWDCRTTGATDGEAYYVGPGHTPEIFPNTEIVEFSPTADFHQTMDVVGKNMESMG